MNNVKKRCRESTTPVPSLYEDELANMRSQEWDAATEETVKKIPTLYTSESSLYRSRNKAQPPLPKTPGEINLERKWVETTAGDQFLLCDDGEDNDRMLIFATMDNLRHLGSSSVWYGDGTFYASPQHFKQLYSIHSFVNGEMYPLIFGFLPNKRQDTYVRFFENVRSAAERQDIVLAPETVMMDFEVAARNAAKAIFPDIDVKGCFFHYTQAVWRKVQECGLQIDYMEDEAFHRLARRAAALPLVPVDAVEDVWFQSLDDDQDNRPQVIRFKDYVTSVWVEADRHQWNHFETVGPRTTNHLEGWHSKLKRMVNSPHPNIFVAINMIQKLQATNEMKILQYSGTGTHRPKNLTYRILEQRLGNLKRRYTGNEMDALGYTDAVAHLIKFGQN